jgi:hypothetical protein
MRREKGEEERERESYLSDCLRGGSLSGCLNKDQNEIRERGETGREEKERIQREREKQSEKESRKECRVREREREKEK